MWFMYSCYLYKDLNASKLNVLNKKIISVIKQKLVFKVYEYSRIKN